MCILDLNPHSFNTVATCALMVQKVASLSLKKRCLSDRPVCLSSLSVDVYRDAHTFV